MFSESDLNGQAGMVSSCPKCDGDGWIPVCYGGDPDKEGRETCPACHGWEPEDADPREAGDDDGVEYADPGDELERRLLED